MDCRRRQTRFFISFFPDAGISNSGSQLDRTEDGIKMILGDNGVSCKLSKRLPDYVSASVADFVEEVRLSACFVGGWGARGRAAIYR